MTKPMLKATEKALRQSIRKWERIVAGDPRGQEEECPLCDRFAGGGTCVRKTGEVCPVMMKTGEEHCYNTPFYGTHEWRLEANAEKQKLRQAEVDFLKSLLPGEKK